MTDFKDDKQKIQKNLSFKEQILAELEKANQIRKEKEEALLQEGLKEEEFQQKEQEAQEAARRTVDLYKKYKEETVKSTARDEETQEKLAPTFSSASDKDKHKKEIKQSQDYSETISFTPVEMISSKELSEDSLSKQEEAGNHFEELDDSDLDYQLASNEGEGLDSESLVRKNTIKRQRTDRVARKISTLVITSFLLLIVLIGLIATFFVYTSLNPVDKKDDKYVLVEIPAGAGNKLIGQTLEKKGLIKNSTVFNFYTKFKNYTNFQSGYYNLQKSMTLEEISKSLQAGGTAEPTKPALGKVLIPEGYTIKQMAKGISDNVNTKSKKDKTPFTSKEFLDLVQDDAFIKEMVKKYPRLLSHLPKKTEAIYQLEGYLFPATYNYYKDSTMKDLVEEMLATTDATLAPYYDTIESSGKTVNEVLTLASLVEKEGSTDEDRREIASVFYNRLKNGMALQSNIAVLYAMDKLGEKTTLAEDAAIDTSIKSPYNIYTNTGLMPGPVDSAGLSAIDATVKPANTDYLYFVANVHTGDVYYAKTYEEHSANVHKYVNSQIE
ncbi:endolytic transglycosylase MltG [Streptococcus didelphis]|uniref:endolytic transglycosylase MltG n=1 Tax=Streptococcus didelphis TaxID=102886 RepID=UPI000370FE22